MLYVKIQGKNWKHLAQQALEAGADILEIDTGQAEGMQVPEKLRKQAKARGAKIRWSAETVEKEKLRLVQLPLDKVSESLQELEQILDTAREPVFLYGDFDPDQISLWNGIPLGGIATAVNHQQDIHRIRKLKQAYFGHRTFSGAIFDLDGTLLDSNDLWMQVDRDFLHRRNLEVPEGYHAYMASTNFREGAVYTKKLFHLSETVEEILDEYRALARHAYATSVPLMEGVLEILEKMKEKNIPMVAATMNELSLFTPALKRLHLEQYFSHIFSAEDVESSKDTPEIYLLAAKHLRLPPEQILVFEDIVPGTRSAKEAGFIAVGVQDPVSTTDQELLKKTAHIYLHRLPDFRLRW